MGIWAGGLSRWGGGAGHWRAGQQAGWLARHALAGSLRYWGKGEGDAGALQAECNINPSCAPVDHGQMQVRAAPGN